MNDTTPASNSNAYSSYSHHHHSRSTSTASSVANPNSNPAQAPPAQQSSALLRKQILDSLVAPATLLRYKRPNPRLGAEVLQNNRSSMDKRHPSSFQQLEKVSGHYSVPELSATD